MTWFRAFRNEHGFTSYADNHTQVGMDVPLLVITYICVLIAIATIIATLGIRGRERWSSALRACYAVAIGSIILACIFGHSWQEGYANIRSPYVYTLNHPFEGKVGIMVALHEANVTLDGKFTGDSGTGYVMLGESMPWADFGKEKDSFSYYLERGLPAPVLKVMEFITMDDGGLRWGRSFHTAGHYASALLWVSFAFWVVCNLLLFSVVVYGAYMCVLTGLSMVLSGVAYHACQNSQPLVISFGDAELELNYGWCFWLAITSGGVTLLLGIALILLDQFAHESVAEFFHLEKLLGEDEPFAIPRDERSVSGLIDRRGSILPPNSRRGSIFLEPGRRPSWYGDNMHKSMSFNTNGQLGVTNKGYEGDKGPRNLLYPGDERVIPTIDYSDDDSRTDMQRANSDSSFNGRLPSLTIQTETNPTPKTKTSNGDIHTSAKVHTTTTTSNTSSRRGSCTVSIHDSDLPGSGITKSSCENFFLAKDNANLTDLQSSGLAGTELITIRVDHADSHDLDNKSKHSRSSSIDSTDEGLVMTAAPMHGSNTSLSKDTAADAVIDIRSS